MIVRTRFAPSPTGSLHLGNIRTALFSWLFARNRSGEFILRIEDTDRERSTQEATQIILDSMAWLGLDYQGPFFQAGRIDHYRAIAENLIQQGLAYRCYCPKERIDTIREQQFANKQKPRYDGECRNKNLPASEQPFVIRFKNPEDGVVKFDDQVFGEVSINNNELDDLVIIRADGYPTYNFSVVVDDLEMQITHVIRGADHINNTPRQINIFEALGAKPPVFCHVPMILGSDGKLLSKRHGALSILQYRNEGYLPEAMLNCLVRLGWSHGDQEIFSREEMISLFDIKDINKSAASFNPEKLLWLNRHYLKTLDPQITANHLTWQMQDLAIDTSNGPTLANVVMAQGERSETLREIAVKSRFLYQDFEDYEETAKKHLTANNIEMLRAVRHRIDILTAWTTANLHQIIEDIAKQFDLKLGKVAQPVRVAITGGTVSPPIDVTLHLLGKTRVLQRLNRAIEVIGSGLPHLIEKK